ncbi:ADAM 17-like protease [Galendromus occidentalis]|uniref:ADAM 17-like protease n=1 Tax=Galendromus occidentalis TaxID=34638 RepID=A0AAJ7PB48_9ACAR|nr:ADAM 17-like protease [Galendromus occidentalis]
MYLWRTCFYHTLIAWLLLELLLLQAYIVSCVSTDDDTTEDNHIRYFETIALSDIRTRHLSKREIQRSGASKEVSFRALGRSFQLILSPTKGLLSAQFKAYTVDRTGARKPVWVDNSQFFEGKLLGEVDSNVSAHIDDGVLTASIRLPTDVYIVEPSWRHAEALKHPDFRETARDDLTNTTNMIVYRASDVDYGWDRGDPSRFCGAIHENATSTMGRVFGKRDLIQEGPEGDPVVGEPLRQYEPTQTRCSLLLVADHKFYENMGGKSQKGTINFIISLIDRVNKIFLDTEWKDNERQQGFRGMGFVIQEVLVHTEPTPVVNGQEHYNMPGKNWNVRELLEVFSRSENHRWFCLAHLFTDQKFEGGILGLAYVGSPRKNSVGGICSPGYVKNGHTLYLNSGLSTSRNHYGHRVITREADLVTAHEFGHNWGSEHDPDLPECSPDSQKGGSYLMYTYSVSGYDANNKRFSPCSVRSIRAVLLAKAGKCFSKPEESFCGNLLVEEGEECDAGLGASSDRSDPCCTAQCKLKAGAKCSDRNSPCCRDCQYMEVGNLCREAMPNACKKEAFCSGESAECPPSKPQEDDSACLDRGKCRAGECLPYCETLGQISCMCDNELDACKRCCRQHQNSTCHPVEPIEILHDGTPCIHGFCEEGSCKKTVQDIVERFWDIIEDIDINTVLKFLHDNIVSLVLLLVTVLWIPVSCLISYADRKRYRQMQEWAKSREPASEKKQPFSLPEDTNIKVIKIPKNIKVISMQTRVSAPTNAASGTLDRRNSNSSSTSSSAILLPQTRQWNQAVRTTVIPAPLQMQHQQMRIGVSPQCCVMEPNVSSPPAYVPPSAYFPAKCDISFLPSGVRERRREPPTMTTTAAPSAVKQPRYLQQAVESRAMASAAAATATPQYEMHNMHVAYPYGANNPTPLGGHLSPRYQVMMGAPELDYASVYGATRAPRNHHGMHGQQQDRSDYL